ncbi:hypothetical protein KQH90_01915 [Anaerosalibacter bizertensis]|nr:hypothetical protein [Anaerosalibacter bizertensis]MBU5292793.1 hypothetical protein [Anaerosalibacter bizertensis]
MKCPKCYKELGKMKKNQLLKCSCGAKLLVVEINKKLQIFDLGKKEEK